MRLFRRSTAVAVVACFVWLALAAVAGGGVASPSSCPRAGGRLGLIAFAARGRGEVIDLARCRGTAIRAPGASVVRFSPDGQRLAYGRLVYGTATAPVVVSLHD